LRDLLEIYLATEVSIEEAGRFVPACHSDIVLSGVVHVITAWNPGHERPTRAENDAANQRLASLLVARGYEAVPAIGSDPDSEHFEESWAVVGMSDEEARVIGAEFGQVAVFRLSSGTQEVLACIDDRQLRRST